MRLWPCSHRFSHLLPQQIELTAPEPLYPKEMFVSWAPWKRDSARPYPARRTADTLGEAPAEFSLLTALGAPWQDSLAALHTP